MKIREAERITGLTITAVMSGAPPIFCLGAYETNGRRLASVSSRVEGVAVKTLVEVVYRIRARETMAEHGFRCFHCGSLKPLECDHITPRSHGRDDTRQNLRALCVDCHRQRTDKNAVLVPEDHVLRSMRQAGWNWNGQKWEAINA